MPGADPPPLRVNRAPVLTLWAAVVAERLGNPGETALTLGSAVAGTAARPKARRLGLAEDRPEEDRQRERGDAGGEARTVRLLGREVSARWSNAVCRSRRAKRAGDRPPPSRWVRSGAPARAATRLPSGRAAAATRRAGR